MTIQRHHLQQGHQAPLLPPMRLEEEIPEETEIRDLESEIGDAAGRGEPTDPLLQKRERVIRSWIRRVEKEIAGTDGNASNLKSLRNQLERAKEYLDERVQLGRAGAG